MRILFLSRWFPFPADNGAKIRIYNLLTQLAGAHEVHLASFTGTDFSPEFIEPLRSQFKQVGTSPDLEFQPRRAKAVQAFLSSKPRSVIDTYSQEMASVIDKLAKNAPPDLIVASQLSMAEYALPYRSVPKILEELEVSLLAEQAANRGLSMGSLRAQMMWSKSARYVSGLLRQFDGYTTVSEAEQSVIQRLIPNTCHSGVIPNGVDTQACAEVVASPRPNTLIYSGAMSYFPNFDAVKWFSRDILPLIKQQVPEARLRVTGKADADRVRDIDGGTAVEFTGYLKDVRRAVKESAVAVVPLRYGGGTRLKILEAMALGTPVVSTLKGAEGLGLTSGLDFLAADTAEEFAQQVVRVLTDAELRVKLVDNAQAIIQKTYDWGRIGRSFLDYIQTIMSARPVAA